MYTTGVDNGLTTLGYQCEDIPALVKEALSHHRVTKLAPAGAPGEEELAKLFEDSLTLYLFFEAVLSRLASRLSLNSSTNVRIPWKRNFVFFSVAPVFQRLDKAIHRINHYPVDKCQQTKPRYPLDSDLSDGERYPAVEQPRPDLQGERYLGFRLTRNLTDWKSGFELI